MKRDISIKIWFMERVAGVTVSLIVINDDGLWLILLYIFILIHYKYLMEYTSIYNTLLCNVLRCDHYENIPSIRDFRYL